jgi:peptidoglycan/xylan/chitin deacetylase (PgdA/CDA1 family)
MRRFCFRFDVDTHRCLRKGVPNLVRLADEIDVRFTFFMNMGRAVSRSRYLRRMFQGGRAPGQAAKLSNLKKLGFMDYLVTSLLNPEIGSSYPEVIRQAHTSGHEIGLHGGRNHAAWQEAGAEWPREKIDYEVKAGLERLTAIIESLPAGFASPGWQGSGALHRVLESLGFKYVADIHQQSLETIRTADPDLDLVEIPTNIAGEPGGVGYVEHLHARSMTDTEILEDFRLKMEGLKELAVVYDHPYYAGIQGLQLVREMIGVARSLGFEVTTLKEIVEGHSQDEDSRSFS